MLCPAQPISSKDEPSVTSLNTCLVQSCFRLRQLRSQDRAEALVGTRDHLFQRGLIGRRYSACGRGALYVLGCLVEALRWFCAYPVARGPLEWGMVLLPLLALATEPPTHVLLRLASFPQKQVIRKLSGFTFRQPAGSLSRKQLLIFDATILVRHPSGATRLLRDHRFDMGTVEKSHFNDRRHRERSLCLSRGGESSV